MKLSKIISIMLIICICACSIASCSEKPSTENNGEYLSEILLDYRDNGMKYSWDILAVYNADHNPLDYNGFDETLAMYDENNYADMTEYCLIVDIATIIGADEGYFENYQTYLKKLRALVEKMNGGEDVTSSTYTLAFYALKGANISFDESKFIEYILAAVNPEDTEQTTMLIPAAVNLAKSNPDNPATPALKDWLGNTIAVIIDEGAKNSDNTFANELGKSAVATSGALNALISYHYYYGGSSNVEIVNNVYDALSLFKIKNGVGYNDIMGKTNTSDAAATAWAAISISSMKNKMSVWDKLMEEAKELEPVI